MMCFEHTLFWSLKDMFRTYIILEFKGYVFEHTLFCSLKDMFRTYIILEFKGYVSNIHYSGV